MSKFRVSEEHLFKLLEGIRNFVLDFENPQDLSDEQVRHFNNWILNCIKTGFSGGDPEFLLPLGLTNRIHNVQDVEVPTSFRSDDSCNGFRNFLPDLEGINVRNKDADGATAVPVSSIEEFDSMVHMQSSETLPDGSEDLEYMERELDRTVGSLHLFRKTMTKKVSVLEFKRKLKNLQDLMIPAVSTWIVRKKFQNVSVIEKKHKILQVLLSSDYKVCFNSENIRMPISYGELVARVYPCLGPEGRNDVTSYFAKAAVSNRFFKELMGTLVDVHKYFCAGSNCIVVYCLGVS